MEISLIFRLFITALLSLNLMNIFLIGRPRTAMTPGQAFLSIIFASFLIYGIWYWI